MVRSIVLVAALLMAGCPFVATAAGRAVWTWEQDSYAMLEDRVFADEAIAFLRAKGIDTVYLYADAYHGRTLIESKPQAYRQLIRRLHRDGIHVYALLGSAYLNTRHTCCPSDARTRWRCSGVFSTTTPRRARRSASTASTSISSRTSSINGIPTSSNFWCSSSTWGER